ncbi:MAG TPA: AraC family transcriptional regulator [Methylibium sp.]|uniref:AraC family transcriptional regulator n=1 Tax=Methylibium sp. TaxID=2067992 RepID=UPI002DB87A1B|nr:AraC family transcriptional regulator [Methylibium sp.]HEU4458534.1 AraC family transcriptional regulator [Methylibium sp.]
MNDPASDVLRTVPTVRREAWPAGDPGFRFEPAANLRLAINFGAELAFEVSEPIELRRLNLLRDGLLCVPPGLALAMRPRRSAPTAAWAGVDRLLLISLRPIVWRQAARRLGLVIETGLLPQLQSLALDAPALALARSLDAALDPFHGASAVLTEQIAAALAAWLVERRGDPAVHREPAPATDEAIEDAVLSIHRNLDRPLTITQLADDAGLSLYHFIRAFKARMGVTPYQYLMSERVGRAQQLLADNLRTRRRQRLADVALEAGFGSHSRLIECFRRVAGCSPSQWQRRIEAELADSRATAAWEPGSN